MKRLISLFQGIRISRVLTIFLVGFALLITTACNSGDIRGARPNNPAVQAGGANNPYKLGGDDHTNYRMSPDPEVDAKAAAQGVDQALARPETQPNPAMHE